MRAPASCGDISRAGRSVAVGDPRPESNSALSNMAQDERLTGSKDGSAFGDQAGTAGGTTQGPNTAASAAVGPAVASKLGGKQQADCVTSSASAGADSSCQVAGHTSSDKIPQRSGTSAAGTEHSMQSVHGSAGNAAVQDRRSDDASSGAVGACASSSGVSASSIHSRLLQAARAAASSEAACSTADHQADISSGTLYLKGEIKHCV